MLKLHHASIAVSVLCLSLLLPAATASADGSSFNGTWVFSGSKSEREEVHDAIDKATRKMNLVTRKVARSTLKKRLPIKRIQIAVKGSKLHMKLGDLQFSTPMDGEEREVKGPRGPVRVRVELDDGELVSKFEDSQGSRSKTVMSLSEDGKRLEIEGKTKSKHFSGTVRYEISYRKR